MSPSLFLSTTFALLWLTASVTAGDWAQFRGPHGNGHADGDGYPTEWSKSSVAWRTKLPGDGNGSPVVSGEQIYLTTASADGRKRTLHCFDLDGKELWTKSVDVREVEVTHKTNPYAGTTPAVVGNRVVVWHGSPGVYCYTTDGRLLWNKDIGDVKHMWGYGSSPVIHEDRVYLNFGPGKVTFMACLDLKSGETMWKTDEPGGIDGKEGKMAGSWSTPVFATVDGNTQLICSMPTRVVAYDLVDGDILWTIGGLPSTRGDLVYTSATVAGDMGIAMGGYKGPSIGFKLGGEGDVTANNRLWQEKQKQPQRIGSGVIIDGYCYIGNAGPGTAQCIDIKTGEVKWNQRLNGNHWGSAVAAGNLVYVTDQKSTTTVFKANPEKFEQVASNKLNEPTNATPAFANGKIYLRTSRALYGVK